MSQDHCGQPATGDGIEDRTQLLRVGHDRMRRRFESIELSLRSLRKLRRPVRCIRACDRKRKGLLYPLSYVDRSTEGFEPPTR